MTDKPRASRKRVRRNNINDRPLSAFLLFFSEIEQFNLNLK